MTAPKIADFGVKAIEGPSTIVLLDGPAIGVPIPRLECLVEEIGLVAGGGAPHLVAGYGFSGKTLALQSLALSLTADRPVWGAYKAHKSRVLHLDFEQGDRLTRRRYQRLAIAMDVDLSGLGDALAVAIMPPIALKREQLAQWRKLMSGRDLVIVDSLRAATAGLDENSSDIRGCLDMLGEASEATRCRAVLIHHSRKPQKDDAGGRFAIRGSSAIYDACDSVYIFSAAKGEPVSVEHAKARTQGDSVPDFALVISDVEFGTDLRAGLRVQVHGCELIEQRRHARNRSVQADQAKRDGETVCQALAAHPLGLGTRELRAVTRLSGDRVTAAVVALGDRVEVIEERNRRGPAVRRHRLRGIR
jgi:RecA-family ATPase